MNQNHPVVSIVARFFWPRQAVALAEKLEAEGSLNRKAVYHFEMVVYKSLLFFVLLIPGGIWLSNNHTLALVMLALSPLLIRWSLWDDFYRFIVVLGCGSRESATVTKFKLIGIYGGQNIDYRIGRDQVIVRMSYHLPIYDKYQFPQEGDAAFVYYYPQGKKFKVVPDLLHLKEKYSFKEA